MAQSSENLDFSGLFKLDVLVHLDIASYSFYELGLKKFLAVSSNKELLFFYINRESERSEKNFDWDFLDNPIFCMCFEPSGTWVLIVSEQKILLVPFLPQFTPQNAFDCKWSLSSVTVLPLANIPKPTTVVWWLTKESENIIIIGSKIGIVTFYSLETQCVVGECKVSSEIKDLQICFDDSLDLLALLISGGKSQQWKLVLEHRSYGYNWLQQCRAQADKRDGFMSYIKQLSKDKITLFSQGGSKDDNKSQPLEYCLKPTEYLPSFRKGSNNWALSAQYVNGRHFLSAFELNEGTLILESPEEETPSRTLRPCIKKDGQYVLGLWTQRLIFLLRKNQLEVHSANFSVVQGEALLGTKRDFTELWTAELIGDVRGAHVMSAKEPPAAAAGWKEPTFLCDLQLPRLALDGCLVVTSGGAYILNTVSEPCEWLVGAITRGAGGAEQRAAALGAPVPALLRAAADLLLSRGNVAPAMYLFSLSQSQPDGWVARLGVFGRLHELSMYKHTGQAPLGASAVAIKMLALLLKMGTNEEETFDMDAKFTTLSTVELTELTSIAAAIGLWDLVPVFSTHCGHPALILTALKSRKEICRSAISFLLQQVYIVPLLLEENAQWLFDFIVEKCESFDTKILKCICLWLNPMQEQLRPVMRDLNQGISSIYTTRMLQLISTFMRVACALEARHPCPDIHLQLTPTSETWKNQFVPRRSLSCGLGHWALTDDGNAKVLMTETPVNTEVIGRVVDVACGRHHTLILTENGIYAAGDNSYGQLGVGSAWAGAAGDAAAARGALTRTRHGGDAPVTAVAAGHYHSAAVDQGGRLYTWGWGVHGQLGHGSIDDKWTPQLVTRFQGRKVLRVGCGACHTVVLTRNGDVWAMGAGVFGQLGSGTRDKSSLPLRVTLDQPVDDIAVGYFHNLALTRQRELWCWGSSPQAVRAAAARRDNAAYLAPAPAPAPAPARDPHLAPQRVDTCRVAAPISQMSAGWHHSCIIDTAGTLYSWGLNFDGQLGSGDRKQIIIPTEVRIRTDSQPDTAQEAKSPATPREGPSKALVACGGDFTVYIDDDGRVYATGNMHLQTNNGKEKGTNRVIMMKTTKRVIKIPASRSNNKFIFQPIDRIDIMFPFDIEGLQRKPLQPTLNPLTSCNDFKNKSWADDIILLLKEYINEDILASNLNMAAKLAFHNKKYSDCLKLLLENLKCAPKGDRLYLTHTEFEANERISPKYLRKEDELKIVITNIMSKRIKDISRTILNEEPYPVIDSAIYQNLPCCCNEMKYIPKNTVATSTNLISESDLSVQAANIIDRCISIFPIDTKLWEICFRLSKDYYLDNNLSVAELERVLRKYMESNATTMAGAIMYSNDCAQYSQILSPKFYLNMCSEVLDTWG